METKSLKEQRNDLYRTMEKSNYKGVYPANPIIRDGKIRPLKKPWEATIYHAGKTRHLGHYKTEREAAIAYDMYVLEHGLDRKTNIRKRAQ